MEAIENYKEGAAVNYFTNNYNTTDSEVVNNVTGNPTFNYYADKLIELYEKTMKEKDAEIERLRQLLK